MALEIKTFALGMIAANCYIVRDAESGDSFVVDPGAYLSGFEEMLEEMKIEKLRYILLTHGHFDHIFGAQHITDTFHVLPSLHHDEVETYQAAPLQMQTFLHRNLPLSVPPIGTLLADGDVIHFGTHTLQVIATPGHTPGGVCYYCMEEALLLSGDSLFHGSIGRCDLPGGDESKLINHLREKILSLPPAVKVYPGHGPSTSISEEQNNPFIN